MDWKTPKITKSWQIVEPMVANAFLYGLLCAGIVAFVVFSKTGRIMLSENEVYFFLLSSVAQSFFAFVAFFGAIALFPFHQYEQEYSSLITKVRDLLEPYTGADSAVLSHGEVWAFCQKVLRNEGNTKNREDIERIVKRYDMVLLRRALLRTRTLSFVGVAITTAIIAIMCIPAVPVFHTVPTLGGLVVSFILGMCVVSVILGWRAVKQMIEETV